MKSRFQNFRILLLPFSLLFWIIIKVRELIYTSSILKRILNIEIVHSKIPIVCVGNIRVGGTGKSQIVLKLAQRLIEKGWRVAILSRGYKRKSRGFLEVDSLDFEKFGDEPVMLKMNLSNAKIFVSEDRKLAIEKINELKDFDFILMDDGLQDLNVAKDLSIVLIDKNFFSKYPIESLLLPAGNLRQTKKSIYNYDCLIYNSKYSDAVDPRISHKKYYLAKYKLDFFKYLDGKTFEIRDLQDENVGAFCGIAQPDSFKQLLLKNSISLQFFKVFPDHHHYRIQDLKLLLKFVEKFGSNYIITTEKDIVRLTKYKNEFEIAGVFLIYTKITAEIKNEEKLIEEILCLKKN